MEEEDKRPEKNIVMEMASHIKYLYENSDPILENVNNVSMLYDALYDLDEIIGMDSIKESIIKLIKFLLIDNVSSKMNKFENHMLHTVIYGQPGVGKTMVGSVLAKIWSALGLIKKKKIESVSESKQASKLLSKQSFAERLGFVANPQLRKTSQQTQTQDSQPITEQDKTDNTGDENKTSTVDDKSKIDATALVLYKKMDMTSTIEPDNKDDVVVKKKMIDICRKIIALSNELDKADQNDPTDKNPLLKPNPFLSGKSASLDHPTSNFTSSYPPPLAPAPKPEKKSPLVRCKFTSPIKIVSRNDFVAQYLGQTADKTHRLLVATLAEGKALFIDEAYSLVNDGRDSYGHEALNELNKFMSEHPELIIIFAGYKDKMESTLFYHQPGFKRRCTWVFNIAKYTSDMIAKIFIKQLQADYWIFEQTKNDELDSFFKDNFDKFPACGGDTLKLCLYCKLAYAELRFSERVDPTKDILNKKTIYKTITTDMLKDAYKEFLKNNVDEEIAKDANKGIIWTMYN